MGKVCRVLSFLGAWWMLVDMVLDWLTVNKYKQMCMEGKLECWMWPLGGLFISLPTIVTTLVQCCGWRLGGIWSEKEQEDSSCFWKLTLGPLYSLTAPFIVIVTTSGALCCTDHDDDVEAGDIRATLQLPEIVCEALPQVSCNVLHCQCNCQCNGVAQLT